VIAALAERQHGSAEVSVARSRRTLSGIRVHRSSAAPDEPTRVRGIPVTTVPWTLIDLATIEPKNEIQRACSHLHVGGRWLECDCLWRSQRVVEELDGRAVHATTAAFERDRARDRALHAEGWRVIRVTWRQLHDESTAIAADLKKMLL
jgi:hypothetical protein